MRIRAAETAVVLGLWASGFAAADMLIVAILMVLAFGVGCISIIADPIGSIRKKLVFGTILFSAIGISWCLVYFRHSAPFDLPPVVLKSQFEEIRDLQKLLGKDEAHLRQEFDIYNVLSENIYVQNIRLGFIHSGNKGQFPYNLYAHGGNYTVWIKEGHFNANHRSIKLGESIDQNGAGVVEGPTDVLFLITTKLHQESEEELTRFENSPLLPEDIKASVVAFQKVMAFNMATMLEVLDAKMHENENYFVQYNREGTPFANAILNEYIGKFNPLKPPADRVMREARRYLKTN